MSILSQLITVNNFRETVVVTYKLTITKIICFHIKKYQLQEVYMFFLFYVIDEIKVIYSYCRKKLPEAH